jgi:hypothetical protein
VSEYSASSGAVAASRPKNENLVFLNVPKLDALKPRTEKEVTAILDRSG